MQTMRRVCLGLAGLAALPLIAGLVLGNPQLWQPSAVVAAVGAAIGIGAITSLRTYQFTAWIVAVVVAAMIYPARFLYIGGLDLRDPWLILIIVQSVMFGMGTQMSLRDFANVARMPWGVFVGIFCQFTIMPLVGYALAETFDFPDEVAAGIILIGSCSSGLASNVMVYLARGNLALSIALTSVATLLAPVMTPFWMKLLASERVEGIEFFKMMMQIVEIVIVPIGAALLHDYLKNASEVARRAVWAIAGAGVAWLAFLAFGGWNYIQSQTAAAALPWVVVQGFLFGAVVVAVAYHEVARRLPSLDRRMPLLSMFGIVYFTAVATAAGRDELLHIGGLLFLAAVIHNGLGYFLGYWLSRAMGLDRTSARTVAFEVGLQNGGMASGIAGAMGKLGTLGLAAAVFSPWMNISGSILANYWRNRPINADLTASPDESNPDDGDSE